MNKDKEVEAYKSGNLTPEEQTKYEIAQELGILDKVLEGGWKSLSAKETGRIGGIMARKKPKNNSILFAPATCHQARVCLKKALGGAGKWGTRKRLLFRKNGGKLCVS